jgi:hypothetical protein
MTEKNLIIDGKEMHFKGIFDLNDFLKHVDKFCVDRVYSKGEKRRAEKITSTGKEFSIELRPAKVKTAIVKLLVTIKMNIANMKEVEVVKNNIKKRMQEGNISMIFDAWIISDYEFRYEQKPTYYFFRKLFERLVYLFKESQFDGEVRSDCNYIYDNMKSQLNLYKY